MSYEDARPCQSGSHNRFTNGHLYSFQHKHIPNDAKFPKRLSTTTSSEINHDKEHAGKGKDQDYKDLILYGTINAFKRLNIHDHHSDFKADGLTRSPDLVARKLDPTHGDPYRTAAGDSSSHKRPPGSPSKPRKSGKKRCDKARRDGNTSDRAEGSGDGRGDDDNSQEGYRFPLPPPAPVFACPFYKHAPLQHFKCMGIRCSRISDVVQHLERCHLLKEVTLGVRNGRRAIGIEKTQDPQKIIFYCITCRKEFFGASAERSWSRHTNSQSCALATIQQSGVMLPDELESLKREMARTNGDAEKWGMICFRCFPGTEASTPYVEAAVPRQSAAEILGRLLSAYPFILVTQSSMPPPILSQSIVQWALNRIFPGSSSNMDEFPVQNFPGASQLGPPPGFPSQVPSFELDPWTFPSTASQSTGPGYPVATTSYSQISSNNPEYDENLGSYEYFQDTQ